MQLLRTFEEMQADSPIDLISRELLLSSLHPGGSRCIWGGAQKGGSVENAQFFKYINWEELFLHNSHFDMTTA